RSGRRLLPPLRPDRRPRPPAAFPPPGRGAGGPRARQPGGSREPPPGRGAPGPADREAGDGADGRREAGVGLGAAAAAAVREIKDTKESRDNKDIETGAASRAGKKVERRSELRLSRGKSSGGDESVVVGLAKAGDRRPHHLASVFQGAPARELRGGE